MRTRILVGASLAVVVVIGRRPRLRPAWSRDTGGNQSGDEGRDLQAGARDRHARAGADGRGRRPGFRDHRRAARRLQLHGQVGSGRRAAGSVVLRIAARRCAGTARAGHCGSLTDADSAGRCEAEADASGGAGSPGADHPGRARRGPDHDAAGHGRRARPAGRDPERPGRSETG